MNKSEIVERMVKIAEEHNLMAMRGAGLPEDQIEQMIDQVKPQIYTIQSDIYEVLVAEGVIK